MCPEPLAHAHGVRSVNNALLQELQHAVASLKQGLTNVQSTLNKRQWHEYLRAVLQEPLQRYSQVQQSSDSFMEVPSLGLPDRLIRRGSKCLSQGKQTQVRPLICSIIRAEGLLLSHHGQWTQLHALSILLCVAHGMCCKRWQRLSKTSGHWLHRVYKLSYMISPDVCGQSFAAAAHVTCNPP